MANHLPLCLTYGLLAIEVIDCPRYAVRMNDDEDQPTISFAERRESAASDTRVRCPRCGKRIDMHALQCEHCGVHFQGEAWEFSPSTRLRLSSSVFGIPRWLVVAIAFATFLAIVLAYY